MKEVKPTVLNFPVSFELAGGGTGGGTGGGIGGGGGAGGVKARVGRGLKSNRRVSKKSLLLRKGLNLVVRSNLS